MFGMSPTTSMRLRDECIGRRVRHLSRVLTRRYDAALSPLGMSMAQLEILGIVELGEPIRPVEIAHIVDADRSTISRNLRAMVDNGWLAERPPATGRGKLLTLTDRGKELLGEAEDLWDEVQQVVVSQLGNDAASILDRWIAATGGGT